MIIEPGIPVQGDGLEFNLHGPGDLWRFAIGTPEAHGHTWALTCSTKTNDVYLSTREHGGGDSKWSFHQSGDWRLQYMTSKAEELGVDRILDQWERPVPEVDGYTEMIRIALPTVDIVTNGLAVEKPLKVQWIPPAPTGMATVIVLRIVAPGVEVDLPPNATPLRLILLPDRSIVMVFRMESHIPPHIDHAFQQAREHTRTLPVPGSLKPSPPRSDSDYRALVNAVDAATGRREIWDLWL